MIDSTKFSILVPVYNVIDYVDACLESIAAQSYSNYEVIVVDDGSTDGSGDKCDLFINHEQLTAFRVIHQQNMGLILARRRAIQEANGDYCVFVDSDDWIAPNLLETLALKIKTDKPDLLIFNKSLYYEKDQITVPVKPLFKETNVKTEDVQLKMLLSDDLNNLVIKAVKTDLLKNDLYDYRQICSKPMGEDLIQSFPIVDNAKNITYLDNNLYYYRQHARSMTKNYSKNNLQWNFCKYNVHIWNFRIQYCKKWFPTNETILANVLNNYAYSIVQHFFVGFNCCQQWSIQRGWINMPWKSICNEELIQGLARKQIRAGIQFQMNCILHKRKLLLSLMMKLRRMKKIVCPSKTHKFV